MARTASELTVEELEVYRRAARRRKWREPQERRRRAWVLARRAADLLRERFRARRVVVFGSLVHEACFTPWSDVDLAACSPSLLAVIEPEGVEV